ncbi:glycosyltransferase family 4 protein [Magnetospirillum fulvum]|uniref:Glycosyltransferase n=1 Tax=Magnetospirillum fulvum MGU-K5 TaxID=1316936 RepID=S9SBF6_MAGFU|nr:glycosyltransferase family 4 protein [Magnetospirillum fulvum]EPY01428.1 glycosyltransferase [Magnetospirillum fulvum MGU-K5]
MHILHTIPGRNWGGMEHRTVEQVRWLKSHGHSVWLATPADGQTWARAEAEALPLIDFDFDRPWRPSSVREFRRLVIGRGIELIDTHVTRDAKVAATCLDLCAVVRSRHVNQPLKSSPIRRMQWRLGADHIITVADCTRAALVADGLADPRRATAIGGWADDSFFAAAAPLERATMRAALGVPADAFVWLCVGMIRPDKGQDHLLDALARLDAGGRRPTLVIVGSATAECAEYDQALRTRAAAFGDRVVFTGYRDDVAVLMRTADAVVIPSLTEAQPRVAVQAFAVGRPVVASEVGGVPEIVTAGETGWLVPAADPAALADAMAAVMDDRPRAAAIASRARCLAETTMRFDHRMEQTLATYRAALDHAHQRPFPRWRGNGR